MTSSTEVSWTRDGIEMFGTVTGPERSGPAPSLPEWLRATFGASDGIDPARGR